MKPYMFLKCNYLTGDSKEPARFCTIADKIFEIQTYFDEVTIALIGI